MGATGKDRKQQAAESGTARSPGTNGTGRWNGQARNHQARTMYHADVGRDVGLEGGDSVDMGAEYSPWGPSPVEAHAQTQGLASLRSSNVSTSGLLGKQRGTAIEQDRGTRHAPASVTAATANS